MVLKDEGNQEYKQQGKKGVIAASGKPRCYVNAVSFLFNLFCITNCLCQWFKIREQYTWETQDCWR